MDQQDFADLQRILEKNGYKVTPKEPPQEETWDDYGSPDKNRPDPLAGYADMGRGMTDKDFAKK